MVGQSLEFDVFDRIVEPSMREVTVRMCSGEPLAAAGSGASLSFAFAPVVNRAAATAITAIDLVFMVSPLRIDPAQS